MADVVLSRVRGDKQQGQAWTVAAAGGRSVVCIAAATIEGGVRVIEDWTGHVVVPAIGVVVGDDDGGAAPFGKCFQLVDGFNQELLFVESIRMACMGILVGSGL